MATVETSRTLSMTPEQAWSHAADLAQLGDWLLLHQGWRSDVPAEIGEGTVIVGVAGAKGLRNRVTWRVTTYDPPQRIEVAGDGVGGARYAMTMSVTATESGCRFAVRLDLGGRPLFGPIGAAAARTVKGDIERSLDRFATRYG